MQNPTWGGVHHGSTDNPVAGSLCYGTTGNILPVNPDDANQSICSFLSDKFIFQKKNTFARSNSQWFPFYRQQLPDSTEIKTIFCFKIFL